MIQRFCAAHNLDVMESMIHLFWVGTIFSLERKEKGLWVFICTISILFVVFNSTNINSVYTHEGGNDSA